jgi:hypothetical protein
MRQTPWQESLAAKVVTKRAQRNQRRREKNERKQNNCLPDIIRSPHPHELPTGRIIVGRYTSTG